MVIVSNMEVIMTKWILAAGLVAFATSAQAQYYGGSSSYNSGYGSSYTYGSNTYGGNNDPSPTYHSAPTYRTYSYQPRSYYSPSYSSGYRSSGY